MKTTKRESKTTGIAATGAKRISRIILLLTALLLAVPTAHAQCTAMNEAFQSGEKVGYDLYFNKSFIWVKVGYASLATTSTTFDNRAAYRMDMLSVSSKAVDIFFKMRDTLTCYVSQELEPLYFRKGAEEGKRYTIDEAWFNYTDGVSHIKQRRTWPRGERAVEEMEYSDSRCIFDMLSILAQARSYDPTHYTVGQRILFPMATGRRVEEQTLIYRGKQNIDANDGITYRCLVFSFVEYDKKGKEKEVITFFVSDDKNHLPIRLDLYLNFGAAKAFLKNVTGMRHPMTAMVKE